jgi:hypothetical protein
MDVPALSFVPAAACTKLIAACAAMFDRRTEIATTTERTTFTRMTSRLLQEKRISEELRSTERVSNDSETAGVAKLHPFDNSAVSLRLAKTHARALPKYLHRKSRMFIAFRRFMQFHFEALGFLPRVFHKRRGMPA